jgi:hypothetical protein
MSVHLEDLLTKALAGAPVVHLPVESGTHVRRHDHSTVLRTGSPLPLQTDAPDSAAAVVVCGGWWPWHLLVQHLRVPGLTRCPAGITLDRIDGRRHLVTGDCCRFG